MAALAPEQHADLEKSGLTEATVALMQVTAVPPGEIKLRGVTPLPPCPPLTLMGL